MESDEQPKTGSASGLMQCLRFLAEEAALLNLQQTVSAIQQALHLAASETRGATADQEPMLLH